MKAFLKRETTSKKIVRMDRKKQIFKGVTISPGRVATRICLYSYKNYLQAAKRKRKRNINTDKEVIRFVEAVDFCSEELKNIRQKVEVEIGKAEAAVFDAQLAILNDPAIKTGVEQLIQTKEIPFESAVEEVFSQYEEMFAQIDDAYLKERSTDIGEIKRRLLNFGYKTEPGFICSGVSNCGRGYNSVIIAEELTAEMMVDLDLTNVCGIVTEKGGVNGHAAILARAAGIPALTGVTGIMDHVECAMTLFLDTYTETVVLNPPPEVIEKFAPNTVQEEEIIEESLEGVTVMANCSQMKDAQKAVHYKADGIGLFRTEILFLQKGKMLSEDEQFHIYSEVSKKLSPKPVTFRLLDIGGDKNLPFLGITKEENPFLGWRGARFLLGNRQILRTQLRALLRTALISPIKIMFPMIADLKQVNTLIEETFNCAALLDVPRKNYKIGVMFEVPSALFDAEPILKEVDFGSIGSNDLMQYLFAVDRNNEKVSADYDMSHPILWHCMEQLATTAQKLQKELSICGELASCRGYADKLIDIGITKVSVTSQLIPMVRGEMNKKVSL